MGLTHSENAASEATLNAAGQQSRRPVATLLIADTRAFELLGRLAK